MNNREHYHAVRVAHSVATRCATGGYAWVYFPLANQILHVDLRCLAGQVTAWWCDPRMGHAYPAGESPNLSMTFTLPIAGHDWVLVLDAAALLKRYA